MHPTFWLQDHLVPTISNKADDGASVEESKDAGVQYKNCHNLSNEEKIQLWESWPNEGDIINGKADREKLCKKPLRCY
jgi:hypothetical protein